LKRWGKRKKESGGQISNWGGSFEEKRHVTDRKISEPTEWFTRDKKRLQGDEEKI